MKKFARFPELQTITVKFNMIIERIEEKKRFTFSVDFVLHHEIEVNRQTTIYASIHSFDTDTVITLFRGN